MGGDEWKLRNERRDDVPEWLWFTLEGETEGDQAWKACKGPYLAQFLQRSGHSKSSSNWALSTTVQAETTSRAWQSHVPQYLFLKNNNKNFDAVLFSLANLTNLKELFLFGKYFTGDVPLYSIVWAYDLEGQYRHVSCDENRFRGRNAQWHINTSIYSTPSIRSHEYKIAQTRD